MTPYELVCSRYETPFTLYPFQVADVNELAPHPRTGLYWDPGLGKTAGSTHCSLYKLEMECDTVLVILPPTLISQWARWLGRFKRKNGKPIRIVVYRGTPAERKKIKLDGDFVLMSIQIFKRDYERIERELSNRTVHVAVDEAHCLKDVGTSNYRTVRDYTMDKSIQLLTGTPLNNPLDAYAYVKFTAPSVYRNLNQFMQLHVASYDFFGKPEEYANLDLLKSNLLINASRKTKEEVLVDLPECIITPIEYDLEKQHYALYRRLAEEQLLKLPDGDKIDATQATALYHALGQIIMQWHYFGQDETLKSAGYDLIEEVLEELGDKKLVVFANYRRTNQEIVRRFNCPGFWGEVTPKQKEAALAKFLDDPKCRLITLQPTSGGVGVDGLQHVCQDILYVEPPIAVTHWIQSLSRIHREGQKQAVTVRMGSAIGTVQASRINSLMLKEDLVQPLQGSKAMLRAALFGEEIKPLESRRLAA